MISKHVNWKNPIEIVLKCKFNAFG